VELHAGTASSYWPYRDYEHVRAFVRTAVHPDEVVYADYAGYYAIKSQARRVFLPYYLGCIPEREKATVTALVIDPANLAYAVVNLGGQWRSTGARLTPRHGGWFGSTSRRLPLDARIITSKCSALGAAGAPARR
jgi:hypothetical protein